MYFKFGPNDSNSNDSQENTQTQQQQPQQKIAQPGQEGVEQDGIDELSAQNERQAQNITTLEQKVNKIGVALEAALASIKSTATTSAPNQELIEEIKLLKLQLANIQTNSQAGVVPAADVIPIEQVSGQSQQAPNTQSYVSVGLRVDQAPLEEEALVNLQSGPNDESNSTAPKSQDASNTPALRATQVPFFTLPKNDQLNDNFAVGEIIGVVPNLENRVFSQLGFKLITTKLGVLSSNHTPYGLKHIVWEGRALGLYSQSCVYGQLDSATFVFEDGRILTINSGSGAAGEGASSVLQSASLSGGLGYIADEYGSRCIPGQLHSNATEYLSGQFSVAALQGVSDVVQQASVQQQATESGDVIESIPPEQVGRAALAGGVGGGLGALQQYLTQRTIQAFDFITIPSGTKISIALTTEIRMDYPTDGRLTVYGQSHHNPIDSDVD